MYAQQSDFKIICDDRDYTVLAQASQQNRNNAISAAMEEVAGYLRSRYDIQSEFNKEGNERNPRIVMTVCDIALWHLVANMSNYEGFEIRQTRYNNALVFLEDIAKGIISPCLPLLTNQNGDDIGNPIRYGDAESKYMW